jgi:hypothetical protein
MARDPQSNGRDTRTLTEEEPVAGRPRKATPKTLATICDAVSAGCTFTAAAKAAGIGLSTLMAWKSEPYAQDPTYAEFRERLEKAEAEGVRERLERIREAGRQGTWQADAWVLERRHPEDYGRPAQNLRLQGHDGGPLQITVVDP